MARSNGVCVTGATRTSLGLLLTFGEGCLQDALPYAHDAGPLIALALEEFEAVEPTSVTPLLAYSSVMEKRSYF